MRLSSLWAVAGLSLAVSARLDLEIGIVHPRNTTFIVAEVFPIVFHIQHLQEIRPPRSELNILWDIMPYGGGVTPGGIWYDSGTIRVSNDTNSKSNYLIATTNVTEWITRSPRDDRFMLQWFFSFDSCGDDNLTGGDLMFNIATEEEIITYEPGEIHRVMDVPECPELEAIIEVRDNTTESQCPLGQVAEPAENHPCYARAARDTYSSILSHASSLAAPTSTTTSATSTSSAGVRPARTVQTALAAACLLGGLAL
ncbi:hypothetical protein F5144DRAFT_32737 [Chaetomium tenue]|uniref:Uncharacterized protein n=1 Tax=Chaetomium tenue TaxID=1854479 RepID=A0ACB7PLF4_9PEZI|nr:hypothetical protein F5144DRAFT_32737 [Chaetomium globosum]